MTIGLSDTLRNNRANQITAFAGANALIRIYAGTRPSKGGSVGGATLLAQLTCNSTFAPGASSGTLTLNAISPATSAAATGTAAWFRMLLADGSTFVMDGSVSTVAQGTGDMQLDNTSIVLGGTVAIATAVLTEGNS